MQINPGISEVEKLFTVTEVAEYLKVKPRTVRQWLSDGEIQGSKIGKSWLIRESDIVTFIDAHRGRPKDKND